mgnify:CR=1 FL=1
MQTRRLAFTSAIAGLDTTAGVRLVQLKAIGPVACRMVRGVHFPPVGFGFSSAPPTPQIVAVRTTIDLPDSVAV